MASDSGGERPAEPYRRRNSQIAVTRRSGSSRRSATSVHLIGIQPWSTSGWGYFWGYEPVTIAKRSPERSRYMNFSIPPLESDCGFRKCYRVPGSGACSRPDVSIRIADVHHIRDNRGYVSWYRENGGSGMCSHIAGVATTSPVFVAPVAVMKERSPPPISGRRSGEGASRLAVKDKRASGRNGPRAERGSGLGLGKHDRHPAPSLFGGAEERRLRWAASPF